MRAQAPFLAYRQSRDASGVAGDWVQVSPLIEFAHFDTVSAIGPDFEELGYSVLGEGSPPHRYAAIGSGIAKVDLISGGTEEFISLEGTRITGMAVDQGKTSNLNALTLLGDLTGRNPGEVGTTTFRPMFMPVTMGAIAGIRQGQFYAPAKRLPAHDWHVARGAEFEDYGGWDRPAYYGDDREECIRRETLLVRVFYHLKQ